MSTTHERSQSTTMTVVKTGINLTGDCSSPIVRRLVEWSFLVLRM